VFVRFSFEHFRFCCHCNDDDDDVVVVVVVVVVVQMRDRF
jgi:hypothetical protein